MIKCISVLVVSCLTAIIAAPSGLCSETSGSPVEKNQQWISHQMNQPVSETDRRSNLSGDRVDEISDLYELAKREQEAKRKLENTTKNPSN
jgi:hypothetical protein